MAKKKKSTKKTPKKLKPGTAEKRKKRGFKPIHENTLKNLKKKGRWKKGESGNPGGMFKGTLSLTHLLRKALSTDDPRSKKFKKTRAEAIINKLLNFANSTRADSALPAIRMILQRIEGKAVDQTTQQAVDRQLEAQLGVFVRAIQETVEDPELRAAIMASVGVQPGLEDESPSEAVEGAQSDSKARAIEFYQGIVNEPSAPVQSRIRAQERLDLLLGHVEPDSGDRSPEQIAEEIRQALAEIEETGGASEPPESTRE